MYFAGLSTVHDRTRGPGQEVCNFSRVEAVRVRRSHGSCRVDKFSTITGQVRSGWVGTRGPGQEVSKHSRIESFRVRRSHELSRVERFSNIMGQVRSCRIGTCGPGREVYKHSRVESVRLRRSHESGRKVCKYYGSGQVMSGRDTLT